MKNFALIGAAGFVAPRHLKAIKATGNRLVAAVDPKDSVGVLDSYFPETAFFTEFERFDRHLEKLKRQGQGVDYVSVCSPNYLHDAHVRFGLRYGAQVICEKPLVLNPWNLDTLREIERETGSKVWNILQLRLHPALLALKKHIDQTDPNHSHEVDLTYITARGHWYYSSWKGELSKSGGIATNIGIHFFDMLIWLFGPVQALTVHLHTHDRAAGLLKLKKAQVRWFLSINAATLPPEAHDKRTFRSIKVDGREVEFSDGFTDLHTLSYEGILAGQGFGLEEASAGIQLAHDIRQATLTAPDKDAHPLAALPLAGHPFTGLVV
ncbi:MAG: Gfo/Idh/MocA family oxidoreductase [Saprospiraceae bacterium]|nr:Gfo/Idh/MocA family oxidoreductase [Saprospiraceae bacterium]